MVASLLVAEGGRHRSRLSAARPAARHGVVRRPRLLPGRAVPGALRRPQALELPLQGGYRRWQGLCGALQGWQRGFRSKGWQGGFRSVPHGWHGGFSGVSQGWQGGFSGVPQGWQGGFRSVPQGWQGGLRSVPSSQRWTQRCLPRHFHLHTRALFCLMCDECVTTSFVYLYQHCPIVQCQNLLVSSPAEADAIGGVGAPERRRAARLAVLRGSAR